jgi:hypothetical protein
MARLANDRPLTEQPMSLHPMYLQRAPNVLALHVLAPMSLRSEFPASREKFPVFPEQGHPNLLMLRRDQPRRHPKKGQIPPNFTNSLVNSLPAGNCGRREHKRRPQCDLQLLRQSDASRPRQTDRRAVSAVRDGANEIPQRRRVTRSDEFRANRSRPTPAFAAGRRRREPAPAKARCAGEGNSSRFRLTQGRP